MQFGDHWTNSLQQKSLEWNYIFTTSFNDMKMPNDAEWHNENVFGKDVRTQDRETLKDEWWLWCVEYDDRIR